MKLIYIYLYIFIHITNGTELLLLDKYYATIAEVDECLKQADFGPDYTPSIDYSNKLRSEFTLNMPLSQEIKVSMLYFVIFNAIKFNLIIYNNFAE